MILGSFIRTFVPHQRVYQGEKHLSTTEGIGALNLQSRRKKIDIDNKIRGGYLDGQCCRSIGCSFFESAKIHQTNGLPKFKGEKQDDRSKHT